MAELKELSDSAREALLAAIAERASQLGGGDGLLALAQAWDIVRDRAPVKGPTSSHNKPA